MIFENPESVFPTAFSDNQLSVFTNHQFANDIFEGSHFFKPISGLINGISALESKLLKNEQTKTDNILLMKKKYEEIEANSDSILSLRAEIDFFAERNLSLELIEERNLTLNSIKAKVTSISEKMAQIAEIMKSLLEVQWWIANSTKIDENINTPSANVNRKPDPGFEEVKSCVDKLIEEYRESFGLIFKNAEKLKSDLQHLCE